MRILTSNEVAAVNGASIGGAILGAMAGGCLGFLGGGYSGSTISQYTFDPKSYAPGTLDSSTVGLARGIEFLTGGFKGGIAGCVIGVVAGAYIGYSYF